LTISMKCRTGLASVIVCNQSGMFSIGLAKPDSSIIGTMNENVPRIACCCVRASDEMNSPMPMTATVGVKM